MTSSRFAITISHDKDSSVGILPIWVGIAPVQTVTQYSSGDYSATNLKENKKFKWKIMQTARDGVVSDNGVDGGKQRVHLSYWASSRSVLGLGVADTSQNQTATGAGPTNPWFWQLQIQDYEGGSIIGPVYQYTVDVHITYYVNFSQRNAEPQS